jgi:hypothetical protein
MTRAPFNRPMGQKWVKMDSQAGVPDVDLMRKIEAAAVRNLEDFVGAFQQVEPSVGADCISLGSAIAAYTGSGSPLTTVKGVGERVSPEALEEIEAFLSFYNVSSAVLEIAPWLSDDSKAMLAELGYVPTMQEDVVQAMPSTFLGSEIDPVEVIPRDEWPEVMRLGFELPNDAISMQLVTAAAHLHEALLLGVRICDRWVACGQSTLYGDVAILGCDATIPEARQRGAQTSLIKARLKALPSGVLAIAEVQANSPSERNYLRCGFQIAYTRTHYVRPLR